MHKERFTSLSQTTCLKLDIQKIDIEAVLISYILISEGRVSLKVGLIGEGAIGKYVSDELDQRGLSIRARIVRTEKLKATPGLRVDRIDNLPEDLDLVIDYAGHSALAEYGPRLLKRGIDVLSVSLGVLADQTLYDRLETAADEDHAKLHLASGAIGALDCLRAAKIGGINNVTYVGRKPPKGWQGSPAENKLDLISLKTAAVHFEGNARQAPIEYPKNANVAAAVALAGSGFDETKVQLIADPQIQTNIHEIHAHGTFGGFSFQIQGTALPDNPRSSALAAMSVIASIEYNRAKICI